MSGRVKAWRLQASWTQTAKSQTTEEPFPQSYAAGAQIVEGRRDWAKAKAQSILGELIATHPAGVVADAEVYVVAGEYSDTTGFILGDQSLDFRVEALKAKT